MFDKLKVRAILCGAAVALVTLFYACSEKDQKPEMVRFSGRFIYTVNGLTIANLPISISIIEGQFNSPLIQRKYFRLGATVQDGSFAFEVPTDSLPAGDGFYSLGLEVDTLVFQSIGPCLSGTGNTYAQLLYMRNNLIPVDHPTYLQITFHKIDHLDTHIIKGGSCTIPYETSLARPDTTFIEYHSFYAMSFGPYKFSYLVVDETGVGEERWSEEYTMLMGDTTKLYIEY